MNAPMEMPQLEKWGERGTAGVAIPARLSLDNVSHAYGEKQVLHSISLQVASGEIVALLGQSGCGKSTLLRIIAGVERQKSGTVLLDDRPLASDTVFMPPEKRGIGLMFQDYALFPHLSILDNTAFGLRALPKKEAQKIARAALARVGLEHHADRYPYALSGGEQQRAALARAIAPRPRVLLMDEPFSGLDRRLRDSVRDETLSVLHDTNATSIMVTHDPEEAMRVADRIVLMHQGTIVQEGSPRALYRHPQSLFAMRFFSEINTLETQVQNEMAHTLFGAIPAKGIADGKAIMGIRHSAFRVLPDGAEGLTARVVSSRYSGEVTLIAFSVAGSDTLIKARIRKAGDYAGKEVTLGINPDDAIVFQA